MLVDGVDADVAKACAAHYLETYRSGGAPSAFAMASPSRFDATILPKLPLCF
jgi:hypothetical protein